MKRLTEETEPLSPDLSPPPMPAMASAGFKLSLGPEPGPGNSTQASHVGNKNLITTIQKTGIGRKLESKSRAGAWTLATDVS